MKYLFVIISIVFFISCQPEAKEITAQDIIDRTIERAGGERYRKATIEFRFRDHTYKSIRNGGEFHLERNRKDLTGHYRDILSNTGYQRFHK
jgi:hypothetical protein